MNEATPQEPLIKVKNLGVTYSHHSGAPVTALRDVTATFTGGTMTAIIGANGAGKSTLFNAITGQLRPTTGTMTINGRITYMPQTEAVNWDFPMTVRDVVLTAFRRPTPDDITTANEALDSVGMSPYSARSIRHLSGGQKKRVFIARALATQAPILILDEPFAGVDEDTEDVLFRVLNARRDHGALILLSTHHLGTLRSMDRIVVLQKTIISDGAPDDTLFSASPSVLLGTSLVDAATTDESGSRTRARSDSANHKTRDNDDKDDKTE
ncbi:metal ABC transporter ATP-binding protein [Corynebacterium kroppenstedtii]